MKVIVNSKEIEFAGGTLAELIGQVGLNAAQVAVERNGVIVYREEYASTLLADGDRIELVRFVGGG